MIFLFLECAGTPCGSSCLGFCSCQATCVCTNCNTTDPCLPGVCIEGTFSSGCNFAPANCNDNNVCTTDSCLSGVGCQHVNNSFPRCDDNNLCTIDTCDPINDCVHTPITCTYPDPCVIPRCFPSIGCDYSLTYSDCSFCKIPPARTTYRTCPDPNGLPSERDDGNKCKVWGCSNNASLAYYTTEYGTNATIGRCVWTMRDCDDGNACTTDICYPEKGTCVYIAVDCDDGDSCTHDTCDATLGCMHTAYTMDECNSSSICIIDGMNSSVPGCCVHTDISYNLCQANLSDQCTTYTCDSRFGCIYYARDCASEVVGGLDNCQVAACNSSTGCYIEVLNGVKLDQCGYCAGSAKSISQCIGSLTVSQVAGISSGVVAAIVIAVVVVCIACGAIGGKVGLDYYRKYRGRMGNLQR